MTASANQAPGSVSRIQCTARFSGRGDVKVSLFRHLAPLTVNAIVRSLPIDSRVSVQEGMACLFTTIKVGVEKPRLTFERGDVAFLASGGLLCFFLGKAKSERPLNPVGKVEEGVERMDSLRAGGVARIFEEAT